MFSTTNKLSLETTNFESVGTTKKNQVASAFFFQLFKSLTKTYIFFNLNINLQLKSLYLCFYNILQHKFML